MAVKLKARNKTKGKRKKQKRKKKKPQECSLIFRFSVVVTLKYFNVLEVNRKTREFDAGFFFSFEIERFETPFKNKLFRWCFFVCFFFFFFFFL